MPLKYYNENAIISECHWKHINQYFLWHFHYNITLSTIYFLWHLLYIPKKSFILFKSIQLIILVSTLWISIIQKHHLKISVQQFLADPVMPRAALWFLLLLIYLFLFFQSFFLYWNTDFPKRFELVSWLKKTI